MKTDKIWFGALYIKDEGGYDIIFRALEHYKKRLQTIGQSPEFSGAAAMFSTVLHQQAIKTIPEINAVKDRIYNSLANNDYDQINNLVDDVQFMEKALVCYKTDIQKALDTKHEYFLKLVGNAITTSLATTGEPKTITEIEYAIKHIHL